jgi:hypothetical protein
MIESLLPKCRGYKVTLGKIHSGLMGRCIRWNAKYVGRLKGTINFWYQN